MTKRRYLHNYERSYALLKKKLEISRIISKNNKDIISKFDRHCQIKEEISLPTRLKYYDVLMWIAKNTEKNFDKFKKEDFEKIVEKIQNREVSIATKQKFRAILKKFGRWLEYGDRPSNGGYKEYPGTVAWINTHIKKKDLPLIKASDILTEEEITKLIDEAEHPRDKAFVSILYETGSRIGEIGGLRIKDVSSHEHGFLIDLAKGKTGSRNVIVVYHASKLANWLNQHPDRDNLNAPLWTSIHTDEHNGKLRGRELSYSALKRITERVAKKSGIKKRIYPHLFRHSRVTHLLNRNELNEIQAKVYFGWTPESKMLANYSHLTSKDVNNTMLRIAGVKTNEKEDESMKVRSCHYCQKSNDPTMKYCGFCGKPLAMETILELDEIKKRISDLSVGFAKSGMNMEEYFKEIVRKEIER